MKKTIGTTTAVFIAAALFASAAAHAATQHTRSCAPASHEFGIDFLGVLNANCSTARTVERYWDDHVILHEVDRRVVPIAGQKWTMLRFADSTAQFTLGAPRVGVTTVLIEQQS